MSNTKPNILSQRIEEERALKQLGTARVKLSFLDFPYSEQLQRTKKANIDRLKRVFRVEGGCRPDDLANRIPAIIDEGQWQQYLSESNISMDHEPENITRTHAEIDFPPGFRLQCLRGRHRVEAARQVLPERDQWWTVDFYPSSITAELKCTLIDEYTNEIKPDDGEFFYKIRQFQGVFGRKNPYFEKRWWARLAAVSTSHNKKERLEQLFRHVHFAPAFDAFQHIPALYVGMRISTLNKMISMKCHELFLAALSRVRNWWYYAFENNESMMRRLSRTDIEDLQNTAPGACERDFQDLVYRVKAGKILAAFSASERERIWDRICSSTTDCLYLKGPADCMKRLIRPKRGETIQSALWDAFADPGSKNTFFFAQADTNTRFNYRDMPKQRLMISYNMTRTKR
ncbi:hypothetical protein B0I35DRAFT_454701 [Stachybotrys elegans]|uniref:Uncharacterized protein n=1 Tax=Stachybotrys elegans TaxID=80388 RepID=A0A8K0SI28_9HYPO|nr:hypothetical protein B0I35DRAFT_454701 [Stachybotrys elegans]